jgi:hypothetical protein
MQAERLMGGIYEVRRLDGFRYHVKYTKCIKNWFSHSQVDREHMRTQTYRQYANVINFPIPVSDEITSKNYIFFILVISFVSPCLMSV